MSVDARHDDLVPLIESYINETIQPEQLEQLNQRLVADPAARLQFIECIDLNAELRWQAQTDARPALGSQEFDERASAVEPLADSSQEPPRALPVGIFRRGAAWLSTPVRFGLFFATLATISFLLTTAQIPVGAPGPPPVQRAGETAQPVARFAGGADARWQQTPPQQDEALAAGHRLHLAAGRARFVFRSGAQVLIEGPATFVLLGENRARLSSGKAVADAPPASAGFILETPQLEVTDLGTEFGVVVTSDWEEVEVFSGGVQLAPAEGTAGRSQVLSAGQHLRVDGQGAVSSNGPRVPFARNLSDPAQQRASAPVRVSSSIELLSEPPRSVTPGELASDTHLRLFREQRGVVLQERLPVSFTEPGEYDEFEQLEQGESFLPEGTRVDSYTLHFDPHRGNSVIEGTLQFDRPILALIVSSKELKASDPLLGDQRTNYGSGERRGFLEEGDLLKLSADRKLLSVRLRAAQHTDQMRVLVEASEPDELKSESP